MAAVKQDYDYNFTMFEAPARAVHRSSAAPARKPKEAPPLRVVPKKTKAERKTESRRSVSNSIIILVFAAVILSLLCLQINAGAKNYEVARQIAAVKSEIEIANSENVRLNSRLNGITSIGNIDDYATRILGMSKVEGYQVEYIDLSEDGGVLYSSGGGFLSLFKNP